MRTHINSIVERSVLCDRNEDRLVVRSGVDGGKFVHASWQAVGDIRSQNASLSSTVESLEECKDGRVKGVGLLHVLQLLNDNMRVSPNDALAIELLRGREIVLLRVDEVTCFQILNGHTNRELLVCLDLAQILGEHEFGRGHPGLGRDCAHGSWVAGAVGDLCAVGDREVDRLAEINEVVA